MFPSGNNLRQNLSTDIIDQKIFSDFIGLHLYINWHDVGMAVCTTPSFGHTPDALESYWEKNRETFHSIFFHFERLTEHEKGIHYKYHKYLSESIIHNCFDI